MPLTPFKVQMWPTQVQKSFILEIIILKLIVQCMQKACFTCTCVFNYLAVYEFEHGTKYNVDD